MASRRAGRVEALSVDSSQEKCKSSREGLQHTILFTELPSPILRWQQDCPLQSCAGNRIAPQPPACCRPARAARRASMSIWVISRRRATSIFSCSCRRSVSMWSCSWKAMTSSPMRRSRGCWGRSRADHDGRRFRLEAIHGERRFRSASVSILSSSRRPSVSTLSRPWRASRMPLSHAALVRVACSPIKMRIEAAV